MIADELIAELDRDPRWMYSWDLGERMTPVLAPFLDEMHRTRVSLIEAPVRAALAAAGPAPRALDLSCCEGWFGHRLLDWGASEVVGVDIREQSVRRAELVRDHFGVDPARLRFRQGDVFALDAEELGQFDVVLCLGLIYHVEHPMGLLRFAREVTRSLLVVESQTARIETPGIIGFTARHAHGETNALVAVHHEPDQDVNPLASHGGVVSFCPNAAALKLMSHAAGFTSVQPAVPSGPDDADFYTGDRLVILARP